MTTGTIPDENDQADMKGTYMDDLPGANGPDEADGVEVDVDVDAQDEEAAADAQEDAAEKREDEGGYQ